MKTLNEACMCKLAWQMVASLKKLCVSIDVVVIACLLLVLVQHLLLFRGLL